MHKSLAEYLAEVRRAIPVGDRDAGAGATAAIDESVDLSVYRPISLEETAVVAAMLRSGGAEAMNFLPQLEGMMVTPSCDCGCPSLAFAPPPDETRVDVRRPNRFVEMVGMTTDGKSDVVDNVVFLALYQRGGKLSGLVVADIADRGKGQPFSLPHPDTLYV